MVTSSLTSSTPASAAQFPLRSTVSRKFRSQCRPGKVIGSEGEARGAARPPLQSPVAWCGILTCHCELLKRGRFSHIAETKPDLGRVQGSWGSAAGLMGPRSFWDFHLKFLWAFFFPLRILCGKFKTRWLNGEALPKFHRDIVRVIALEGGGVENAPCLLSLTASVIATWCHEQGLLRPIFLGLDHCSWTVFPLSPLHEL